MSWPLVVIFVTIALEAAAIALIFPIRLRSWAFPHSHHSPSGSVAKLEYGPV
jgi:hypothetical protein